MRFDKFEICESSSSQTVIDFLLTISSLYYTLHLFFNVYSTFVLPGVCGCNVQVYHDRKSDVFST